MMYSQPKQLLSLMLCLLPLSAYADIRAEAVLYDRTGQILLQPSSEETSISVSQMDNFKFAKMNNNKDSTSPARETKQLKENNNSTYKPNSKNAENQLNPLTAPPAHQAITNQEKFENHPIGTTSNKVNTITVSPKTIESQLAPETKASAARPLHTNFDRYPISQPKSSSPEVTPEHNEPTPSGKTLTIPKSSSTIPMNPLTVFPKTIAADTLPPQQTTRASAPLESPSTPRINSLTVFPKAMGPGSSSMVEVSASPPKNTLPQQENHHPPTTTTRQTTEPRTYSYISLTEWTASQPDGRTTQATVNDPLFGREIVARLDGDYFSAAGLNCRRVRVSTVTGGEVAEVASICQEANGSWFLASRVSNTQDSVKIK